MTQRQLLAREFVFCWLAICQQYGRRTYLDYRVRAARLRYVAECMRTDWRRAA